MSSRLVSWSSDWSSADRTPRTSRSSGRPWVRRNWRGSPSSYTEDRKLERSVIEWCSSEDRTRRWVWRRQSSSPRAVTKTEYTVLPRGVMDQARILAVTGKLPARTRVQFYGLVKYFVRIRGDSSFNLPYIGHAKPGQLSLLSWRGE